MMLDELIEKDLLQTKMRIAGDDGFNYGIFNIPSGDYPEEEIPK